VALGPHISLDPGCLSPRGAGNYSPVLRVPLPVGGIVLFWGAAIPGDIPHIGTVGTSPGVPSPRHYARNAWKGPSESASGPSSKPVSRVCPSVRSRPPRVSAPVGTQLLGSDEAREIPRWLSQQRGPNRPDEPRQKAAPSQGLTDLQTRWQSSSRCREWLEHLDCGELVVVNLRPETDPETEYVSFDRPRVLQVLSHIIADLDELAGYPPIADEEQAEVKDPEARRARHRRRLAEPDPPAKAVERSGKQ